MLQLSSFVIDSIGSEPQDVHYFGAAQLAVPKSGQRAVQNPGRLIKSGSIHNPFGGLDCGV